MGPDKPDLAKYFVSDPNFPVASHCGPFRSRNVQKLIGPGLDQGFGPGLAQGQAQGLAQGPGLGLAQGPGLDQIISAK